MVLATGEERDAAGADESALKDRVVVVLDLGTAGPFLQPGLGAVLLHLATAENRGRDAVEQRCLMELHERIRILPVTARGVATVDERDMDVGMVDEGVGEGHAHRARTHHEVIGLQRAHRRTASWLPSPIDDRRYPSERRRSSRRRSRKPGPTPERSAAKPPADGEVASVNMMR